MKASLVQENRKKGGKEGRKEGRREGGPREERKEKRKESTVVRQKAELSRQACFHFIMNSNLSGEAFN